MPSKAPRILTTDDVLEPHEVDRLVAAADERWWAWFYCTAWVGWRMSEGARLERRDLDLDPAPGLAATITIRGTKTDAAVRVIPIPKAVAGMLRWHLAEFVPGDNRYDLLFSRGPVPEDRYFLAYLLQKTLRKADLSTRGINYPQLRHTCAAFLLAAGVTMLDLSHRLGHNQSSTTSDIYAQLLPRVVESGTAAIELFMEANRAPQERHLRAV